MNEALKLTTPLEESDVIACHAGDAVLLSGIIYTARDAAHQCLLRAIENGETLPFDPVGQVIYYCGPAPAPPGMAIGSAGPTSSYRMDPYTPLLHELGLRATIGKGNRSEAVRRACVEHKGLYLAAVGGAGALLARSVKEARVIAYPELGPEAVRCLVVEDFPAIVAYDCCGRSVFPGDQDL